MAHIPRQGRLGQLELGLVEIDLPDSLFELGLVRSRIDHEEEVALLDLRPFLERHLHKVARGPRADIHRLNRLGPAGEVHELGDRADDRLADRDDGRRGSGDLGRPVVHNHRRAPP